MVRNSLSQCRSYLGIHTPPTATPIMQREKHEYNLLLALRLTSSLSLKSLLATWQQNGSHATLWSTITTFWFCTRFFKRSAYDTLFWLGWLLVDSTLTKLTVMQHFHCITLNSSCSWSMSSLTLIRMVLSGPILLARCIMLRNIPRKHFVFSTRWSLNLQTTDVFCSGRLR